MEHIERDIQESINLSCNSLCSDFTRVVFALTFSKSGCNMDMDGSLLIEIWGGGGVNRAVKLRT